MSARGKYNSSGSGRTFLGELIFWIILLGLDAVFMYLIHRSFGQWYNYQDTMPIMLPVGAFIPLAAVVLRYFPKNTAAKVIGLIICVPVAIAIGTAALHAFYGENAPLDRLIYGDPFPGIDVGEVSSVSLSEYQDGEQIGEPVFLDVGAYGESGINMDYRSTKKETPDPEDYMLFTYTGKDGKTCELKVYDDGKYGYLSIDGQGKWRRKNTPNLRSTYLSDQDLYRGQSFKSAFTDHMEDKEFALSTGYTGAGKAVWMEEQREEDGYSSPWWDRFIPDGFEAERVIDVKYVFTCEIASSTYQGYWYDARTGQKLSDSYSVTYKITAYDLEDGDTRVLTESTSDIFDADELIKAYLEEKTGQVIEETE